MAATRRVDALAAPGTRVSAELIPKAGVLANHMTHTVIGFSVGNAATRTARESTATPGRRRGTAVVAVLLALLVPVLLAVVVAVVVAVVAVVMAVVAVVAREARVADPRA